MKPAAIDSKAPRFYPGWGPEGAGWARPLAIALRRFWAKVKRRLIRRSFDQWILLFRFGDDLAGALASYRRLVPPEDRFWADPFVVFRDGRHYVFFEEFLNAANKGHISVVEIDSNGSVSAAVPVLVADHHLSYPFIFEQAETLYMIPESKPDHRISLYRCVEFPHRWEFVKVLMDGVDAVDATLCFYGGKWWMFANLATGEHGSTWDSLYLFYADRFDATEWTPHPRNPIISDISRARPAGRIFERGGTYYRPSQDCSRRYGYALNLNAIERLDETDYRERVVSRTEPLWADDVVAVHTYNFAGRLHVIDAQVRRPLPRGDR